MLSAPENFTITLDSDPGTHATIAQITGIETKWFRTIDGGFQALQGTTPLAIFVDARLSVESSESGQLIPKLKDTWPTCPIILTAGEEDAEMLTEAMALGADDFVEKPFSGLDLDSFKRRFAIRRSALAKRAARETINFGDVTIDTLQRSVTSNRGQRFLSPTEVKLVSELAKAGGNVVAREALKTRCWPQMAVSDNALNRKLYEIRRRLKPITDCINIRTIYGVGFIMEHK